MILKNNIARLFILLFAYSVIFSEGDKKNSFDEKIVQENASLNQLRAQLIQKSLEINELFENKKDDKALLSLREEIKKIKDDIFAVEHRIHREFVDEPVLCSDESYAFWDQGETTLSQLIMEYGSSDFLFVIPPELSTMKISLFSSIPIPRSSWPDMIELILNNNGIGVKKVNSFVRQLYVIKQDLSNIEVIASELKDISHLPDHSMVFFVFSCSLEQVKPVQAFFERYADPKQANIQIVGNKIVIVASKKNVERLLLLHSAIWGTDSDKLVKVVKLTKLNSTEVEKIIKSFFEDAAPKARGPFFQSKLDDLVILPMPDNVSLVLVGAKQMVNRAEKMIGDLENQLDDPGEMTIFWYTCKHSDPQDIAEVLSKVYASISSSSLEVKIAPESNKCVSKTEVNQNITCQPEPTNVYDPVNPISPGIVEPGIIDPDKKTKSYNNFVVDPKTGSILMTVRKEELDKIKNILKKLDVPKKMVQIDVLLVERKLQDRKQSGINILKIGTNDVKNKQNSIGFDTTHDACKKGVLDFIFRKPKGHLPSFDLTLSFLMAQEDLKINANPSVLAINQTTATISIQEEISISNGAVQTPNGTSTNGWNVQTSYTRAQYGINIVMTPTIHLPDPDNPGEKGFVTLQTNVNFDTPQAIDNNRAPNDRPPVTRRQIINEVRIADGEAIILGGLRRKSQEDSREKIPFLGDLPFIGKLFGTTKLMDNSTEMFIFITPRIIKDPIEDLRYERQQYLAKRPGDIPEFLEKIEQAKNCERKRMFENSMRILFEKP